jgi:hypothetical protein
MTQHLTYATPHRSGPSIWAAAVLALVGLGLIGLGGCFLIGVMLLQSPGVFGANAAVIMTPGTVLLLLVLYGMAAVCFLGALYLLVTTARKLYKLLDAT